MFVGLLVLIGWQFDVAVLKAFLPAGIVMKANTGAAFLLAGLALIVLQRLRPVGHVFVRFCGVAIALVGLLTLCEYLFGWNLGIDQVLFREPGILISTSHPGRMAPNTALNFVLLGFAFFLVTFQRFRSSFLVEFSLIFPLVISVLGLVGHFTGLAELTGPSAYTQIAANTAGTFIILCVGMLFTAHEQQRAPITIEQKLFVGLTIATAVIIFISFLSVSSITSLVHASAWVAHTHQVKNRLEVVLSHVLEVQSTGRGFVLTSDDKYLRPRERASHELPSLLKDLRLKTIDNPNQQRALVSLERLIQERLAFSDTVISTSKMRGQRKARLLIATNRGNVLTDSIRALVAQMIEEEDRLLQKSNEVETHQANRTQIIIYLSLTMQALLLALILVVVNRDLTGRRKAEMSLRQLSVQLEDRVKERTTALQESEQKFSLIFKKAPFAAALSRLPDGAIVEVNEEFENLFGYSRQEAVGRTSLELGIYPDSDDRMRTAAKVQERGSVRNAEMKLRTKSGNVRDFLVNTDFVEIGKEKHVLTIAKDITERKRAEEVLRESENRYRSLFENMLEGYAYCQMLFDNDKPQDFIYINVNIAFEKLTGLTNVVGKKVSEVIPGIKDSNPELFEIYGRVALTGKPERFETYVEPLGIWFSVSVYSPEKEYFVAVFDNITERKQAEEALLNAEKRYRSALDYMLEGCQIIGFDWRYIYINDVAAKQGRHTKEELIGRTMMEIYPGIEDSQMFPELHRCMKERIPHRMENEFTFEDGTKGWFHLSMEPVPEGMFILSQDITKEKQLDEELRKHREHLEELVIERTAQLEAANKELEAFSYSVSHDLRAPLRAIDGFSRLLIEQHSSQLDHEGQRFLKITVDSTAKMSQLIDDLLAFSRLGRQEMRKWSVDMTNLAQTVAEEAKKAEPGRTIEVIIHPLNHADSDGTMMRQVWLNLVSNAFKFTRNNANPRVEIGSYPEGRDTVYFVKDNGAGFDMQYVNKLFGVFQRLHRQDDYEGTGVGLGIVQRVVHRHRGRVWAEGKVNEGATFYFTLPMEGEKSS